MSELTDDQLDGLFRKSAEEYEAPFDNAAWRDMKTRLDANDRTRTGAWVWKKLLRWGIPLFLLLGTGSALLFRSTFVGTSAVNTLANTQVQSQKQSSKKGELVSSEVERRTDLDLRALKTQPLGGTSDKGSLENRKENSFEPVLANNKLSSNEPIATTRSGLMYSNLTRKTRSKNVDRIGSLESKPYVRKRANAVNHPQEIIQHNVTNKRYSSPKAYVINGAIVPVSQSVMLRSQSAIEEKSTSVLDVGIVQVDRNATLMQMLRFTELASLPMKWPKSFMNVNRDVVLKPDTTLQRSVAKPLSVHELSIRAVVAPDLSSIGLKNISRPGTNLGIMVDYRFAARWSVQAGVLQSTKLYRALPSEYTAPYGMWGKATKKPESVDGRCNMLDIPINLRYDVVLRSEPDGRIKSRWFVSGGSTTYVMNEEYYKYNYPAHTYNQRADTTMNTGAYGFSHLNVSVGYERSLNRRLSWQVEPFVKMPLQRVGYFSINLLSTGVFFSLRYKLH